VRCDPTIAGCPTGTLRTPSGACLPPSDAAPSDAAANDGGSPCQVHGPETCNGLDGDCNGTVDDGPAANSCSAVEHGEAGCSAGACYASSCSNGWSDCDHQVANGCEAHLADDLLNCGACGNACGWDCTTQSECDDAVEFVGNSQSKCVLRESGTVVCWGANDQGQLGDGTTEPHATPEVVPGLTEVIDLAGSGNYFCAVRRGGDVLCWGRVNGTAANQPTPTRVNVRPATRVELRMTVGFQTYDHGACSLTSTRSLDCWGGIGGTQGAVARLDTTEEIRDYSVGATTMCVLFASGRTDCRGLTQSLDGGTASSSLKPIQNSGADLLSLTDGAFSAAYLCTSDRSDVWCQGTFASGDGTSDYRTVATKVMGLPSTCSVSSLWAYQVSTCLLCESEDLYCWGGAPNTSAPLVATLQADVHGLAKLTGFGMGVTTSGAAIEFAPYAGEVTVAPRPAR
jgi:Regulator of chromosome condensation (RCC1) repeat